MSQNKTLAPEFLKSPDLVMESPDWQCYFLRSMVQDHGHELLMTNTTAAIWLILSTLVMEIRSSEPHSVMYHKSSFFKKNRNMHPLIHGHRLRSP
jgi:hypothetical protein